RACAPPVTGTGTRPRPRRDPTPTAPGRPRGSGGRTARLPSPGRMYSPATPGAGAVWCTASRIDSPPGRDAGPLGPARRSRALPPHGGVDAGQLLVGEVEVAGGGHAVLQLLRAAGADQG